MGVFPVRARFARLPDPVRVGWLIPLCMSLASMGVAIVQLVVLRSWYQASWTLPWLDLCIGALLWTLGAQAARLLDPRDAPRLLVWGLVPVALLGDFAWTSGPSLLALPLIGVSTLLLGTVTTMWLACARPWPPVSQEVALLQDGLVLVPALAIAWLVPAWALLIGGGLLLPLLLLDAMPARLAPADRARRLRPRRARSGSRILQEPLEEALLSDDLLVRQALDRQAIDRSSLPAFWWTRHLAARGLGLARRAAFTSAARALLAGLWWIVPTMFAAHLLLAHRQATLLWLVAADLVAALVACLGFAWLRRAGLIGLPERLLPDARQRSGIAISSAAFGLLALGLLALGLPMLQADWHLALSLSVYTACSLVWSRLSEPLLPRLMTEERSRQRLVLWDPPRPGVLWQWVLDEEAWARLAWWQSVLTLGWILWIGWAAGTFGVDAALLAAGGTLLALLLLTGTCALLERLLPGEHPAPRTETAASGQRKEQD